MSTSSSVQHIQGLFDLACRSGVDIRPTLLRVLTDLYVQKLVHSAEEKAEYAELAGRLLDHVDEATRNAIANRLIGHPDTPPAIASRLGVPTAATPAGKNSEPAGKDLLEPFFSADSYERRLILTNLAPSPEAAPSRKPPAAHETCRRLEAAALSQQLDDFTNILESALLLPRSIAERITRDRSGEPVVIAARSLGMPADVLQRILLFINPTISHSVQRVYELAALYDEISHDTAESMLAIWRGRPLTISKPVHQPVLHDDEQHSARMSASTMRYQTARRSDALAARFKSTGR
jgi:uncharacterized protein (DUF2336 family)